MGSYFKTSFFSGRFCFLDNRSDRCSTVRYMYVKRHMIKLPTTIDSVCNSGMSEDEFHFLLHCPKYSIPREKFYSQIQHNFVDSNQLSSTELLIKLMNSQNFSLNSDLLRFVSLFIMNDLRNNLLSNHTDDTWLTIVIIAL